MTKILTKGIYPIGPHQLLAGTLVEASTVVVRGGLAWITIEGSVTDHWLSDGEALDVPADRLVVIEADASPLRLQLVRTEHLQSQNAGKAPPANRYRIALVTADCDEA